MTELTVLHNGVPIGVATTRLEEGAEPTSAFDLSCLEFRPLTGYATVAPVIQLATTAFLNLGCLGPVTDPESDLRGQAATEAAEDLVAELELADARGRHVPGRVTWFQDDRSGDEPSFTIDLELEDAEEDVAPAAPAVEAEEHVHA